MINYDVIIYMALSVPTNTVKWGNMEWFLTFSSCVGQNKNLKNALLFLEVE